MRILLPLQHVWLSQSTCWVLLRLSSLDPWLCVCVGCPGLPCIKGLQPFHGLSQCKCTRSVCQTWDPPNNGFHKFRLTDKICILEYEQFDNVLLTSFDIYKNMIKYVYNRPKSVAYYKKRNTLADPSVPCSTHHKCRLPYTSRTISFMLIWTPELLCALCVALEKTSAVPQPAKSS